jgi:hypothetical protein
VSFSDITLCVASQRVFIVAVVYFVIDSVRKLLDTSSYIQFENVLSRTLSEHEMSVSFMYDSSLAICFVWLWHAIFHFERGT